MPYARANGLSLYYEMEGEPDAPHLLLISGLGGDHRGWHPLSSRLRDSFRVVSFDNRDSGLSQRAEGPYTIRDMAEDVAGLLGELAIARTHVVGLSMGGAIAQELAISFPHLVDRLVLLATFDAGDPRATELFRGFAALTRALPREEFLRVTLPWIYTYQDYQIPGLVDQAVKERVEDSLYQEPDAYDRQMEATIAFHSRERLHAISCPTLLVFGEDDIMTPLRFARELVRGIRGSRLVILEGAGHSFRRTRGGEVAALIDAFLKDWALPRPTSHRP
ncbi:MAG: putative esterase/lipase [Dehalococcoidia bacterium]|nr:putative esterase/lipase [Dehalococcoidia bacterium]